MSKRAFKVELTITPECKEPIDEGNIGEWLRKIFTGCDLGSVEIGQIGSCKERYLLIGGNPFVGYTGTEACTHLNVVGSADSKPAIKKMHTSHYEECGGLLLIIDTYTMTEAEVW